VCSFAYQKRRYARRLFVSSVIRVGIGCRCRARSVSNRQIVVDRWPDLSDSAGAVACIQSFWRPDLGHWDWRLCDEPTSAAAAEYAVIGWGEPPAEDTAAQFERHQTRRGCLRQVSLWLYNNLIIVCIKSSIRRASDKFSKNKYLLKTVIISYDHEKICYDRIGTAENIKILTSLRCPLTDNDLMNCRFYDYHINI